jgi:hypothetical protein
VRQTRYIFDHNENVLSVHHVEDVGDHIDLVANERNSLRNGFSPHGKKDGGWRKIGSIPMIILDQWFKEGFNPFRGDPKEISKEVKRRLNEMSKFKTVDKQL